MTTFHALIREPLPGLHLWRLRQAEQAAELKYDVPTAGLDVQGLQLFRAELDHQVHEPLAFKLFSKSSDTVLWEQDAHSRFLPRLDQYRFPTDLWIVHGVRRVLLQTPFTANHERVRIHVITANKYRESRLYVWLPGEPGREIAAAGAEPDGVYFDIALSGMQCHLFAFKIITRAGRFEADAANRLWSSHDGSEIWTHADTDAVLDQQPERRALTVHYRQGLGMAAQPRMRLWGVASDFVVDIPGTLQAGGHWTFHESGLFTGHEYRFRFYHAADGATGESWEHAEAERWILLPRGQDAEYWTLEGDHRLFAAQPACDRRLTVEVVDHAPTCTLAVPLLLDVWVNRGRGLLHQGIQPDARGRFSFDTYPQVVTSFKFRSATTGTAEAIERHTYKVAEACTERTDLFCVLDRQPPLLHRPALPLFKNPPFQIERPGVWVRDGKIRFAVHAPTASRVQLIGEWTQWRSAPFDMFATLDGSYWWAEVPRSAVRNGDYHAARYKFLINDVLEQQDPAADWVESSDPQHASQLVDHSRYQWRSDAWQTPTWDYLIIYQLHPKRFTSRFAQAGTSPLDQVAEEIRNEHGYLRKLGITAVQLLPVNEFAGSDSWGYNPAFFYAVESAYGGPEALKRFVDVCHEHGIAVLLDVVFNHAGTSDNALWAVARDSFFKGDSKWGAMPNFAQPQVIHFFEENLRYLVKHYRVDGFRFDHTRTIRYSDQVRDYVIEQGSPGGWEFLHKLRRAVHAENARAILAAEHLANEWDVTNFGGPMDSQWCDDFHDRLEDACRGQYVMPQLADALKITHTHCDDWYKATNYPTSHDEVGNENDRIAQVGQFGQGLRRNKVAAAVTMFARGIPMWFMGEEAGETKQFLFDRNDCLDIDHYETDEQARRVRAWWTTLTRLRRSNPKIQGPAPLKVEYAHEQLLVFSRGDADDYIVIANFGGKSGRHSLAELNLPDGQYAELWNSTWPAFQVEHEDEVSNGGRAARLSRNDWLSVPDYGVVVLERA